MTTISNSKILKYIIHNSLQDHKIKIESHSDPNFTGIIGKIIGETKQLIEIQLSDGRKIKIPKGNGIFIFTINDVKIKISGKLLLGDPKSRAKRKIRNW